MSALNARPNAGCLWKRTSSGLHAPLQSARLPEILLEASVKGVILLYHQRLCGYLSSACRLPGMCAMQIQPRESNGGSVDDLRDTDSNYTGGMGVSGDKMAKTGNGGHSLRVDGLTSSVWCEQRDLQMQALIKSFRSTIWDLDMVGASESPLSRLVSVRVLG